MRQRRGNPYRPVLADELEARVVLSHAGARGPSVLVAGLAPGAQSLARRGPQPVVPLVNLAFDSFVRDYTQARAAYLSTIGTTGAADANAAFTNYTTARVDLLGQQIISAMLQVSASNAKQSGRGFSIPALIMRRLNGRTVANNTASFTAGTLGQALVSTTPGSTASPAAASLDALAQDQSIAAARVSIINGFNIIKNGDFGNKSKSGK